VNLRSASGTMLIGIVAIALVAVASWMLLISPVLGDTSSTNDSISAAQDRNRFMTTQVAALKVQEQNLSSYEAVAADLETLFPPTADQPGFFAAVTKAAEAAGIPADKVTTLSPSAPQLLDPTGQPIPSDVAATQGDDAPTPTDVAAQIVSVAAEGSYGQVQQLLANLEDMQRAFMVTSLDVAAGSDAEGATAGTLTVSITGSTYVASPLTLAGSERKSSTSAAG
jgi:Tfp pilus assembly protein PilO